MEIREYINNRKLEMLKESQSLEAKRKAILNQGQQLQALLTQTTDDLKSLDIELSVLDKIESAVLKEGESC